jgi:alkyl sulfatase BDS1-like metallo-beta-lactamase superfamily hydrolase
LPFPIENLIVQLKREYPSWGAPKIREKIRRRHSEILELRDEISNLVNAGYTFSDCKSSLTVSPV